MCKDLQHEWMMNEWLKVALTMEEMSHESWFTYLTPHSKATKPLPNHEERKPAEIRLRLNNALHYLMCPISALGNPIILEQNTHSITIRSEFSGPILISYSTS